MDQSQNYNYPQPPPQYYTPPPPQSQPGYANNAYGGNGYAELGQPPQEKIRPSSGFKDIWAAGLWICNLVGFIVLSVIGLRAFSSNQQHPIVTLDANTARIFGYSAIVGFGLSFLYLLLANAIIVYFGVTIYYFARHYYSAAIVFLIFSLMLETVTSITRRYKSTIITGLLSLILQTLFSIWFVLTVVGVYNVYNKPTGDNATLKGIMVFLVFSFYWTSQVISYATHVILAGVFATVYFVNNQIRHPIWGSARRALTTSFGTVCFGSLLIALINLVRFFVSLARSNSDSALLGFVLCIVECIVACVEGIFEWFTYYAFSGVAIYGDAFIPTAKRTWTLIKDRGVDAIINDNLIGNVLFMGGLLVGILSSLLGFIYLEIAKPAYNANGGMTAVVVLVCFLIGSSMFSTIATVISSGVATTFVCLAEDPDALRRTQPMLFEKIRESWPEVVQGI
ncbi:putative choline transporter, neither null mutation nor overexpression affects choline transport [Apophysomyces ossiformis]|uniref:Protein PNS1 n=1 Tax=Apophysomyces ossiformis TaxID=679940 RepID=A0A8H7EPT8_9FUNG|nr:putative choline transporter, neither null mutation nor overexpression affects choline transport [Apophysomyces ossiformis]